MYDLSNIVIMKIPHISIYEGESDKLLTRTRTDECEKLVMEAVMSENVQEPNWFYEKWDDEEKQLYAIIIFEEEGYTQKFLDKCKEKIPYVWDDKEDEKYLKMANDELKSLNEKWQKAHDDTLKAIYDVIDKAKESGTIKRSLMFMLDKCDGDPQDKFSELSNKLRSDLKLSNDSGFSFEYSAVATKDKKKLVMSICFKSDENMSEFLEKVTLPDGWDSFKTEAIVEKLRNIDCEDMETEMKLQSIAAVLKQDLDKKEIKKGA